MFSDCCHPHTSLALTKQMKGMSVRAVDQVGTLAYKVIKMIAKGNKKTVRQIKLIGGIDLMIKHRLGTSGWEPPITDLLSINEDYSHLRVISRTDVEQLLDNVYRSIQLRENPDPELYHFMVDMCAPDDPDTSVQGELSGLFFQHLNGNRRWPCWARPGTQGALLAHAALCPTYSTHPRVDPGAVTWQ